MKKNLDDIKELGFRIKDALLDGNTDNFSELLNEHWQRKQLRSTGITNSEINEIYRIAIKNGARGGKLVGAGGGGFLLFYASDKEKLRSTMKELNLEEVRFKFDFEGTKVILS